MRLGAGAKVLVTGGCGFIGGHLVAELVKLGASVTIVDDLRTGSISNVDSVLDRVDLHRRDIGRPECQGLLVDGSFDVVFHLASNSYVPPSVEDPWEDFQNTLGNTLALLEVLRLGKSKARLIYPSSAAVYGEPTRVPITEDDPTVPVSPYGVAKLASERYVRVYSQLYGIRAASLRFFSIYGPRQTKQVVYDFMCKLRSDPRVLQILGDGKQMRDFLFVKDAVAALILVAEKGLLNGEVYNAASGSQCTIDELADHIAEALEVVPCKVHQEGVRSGRSGDPQRWLADTSRLRQLGFEPVYRLQDGLRETLRWFDLVASRK